MRLFNLFKGSRLAPSWRFSVGGVVWRIYPTGTGEVVGEERDPDKKSVGFFCLDGATGQVRWEKKNYGEQWWIGIEAVHRDVAVLHRFATPDLPEHRGIILVDLATGEELWRNEQAKFIAAHDDGILLALNGSLGLETVQVHVKTGAPLANPGYSGDEYKNSSTAAAGRESRELQFGVPLDKLGTPEAKLKAAAACASPSQYGDPVALDAGNTLIVAWWEEKEGSSAEKRRVRGEMGVIDGVSGAMLYRDTADTELSGIVPDPFVVRDGTLYYVRERSTLIAVRL